MEESTYFEKIESFLMDTMNPEQRRAFLEEIEANPTLKEDVEAHRMTLDVIEMDIAQNLRNKLKTWSQENGSETKEVVQEFVNRENAKRRMLFKPLAIAASLLLLVAAGLSYYSHSTLGNEAIYASLPSAYVESNNRTSTVNSSETTQAQILKYYK
ncbi:MAG: hypothetical protein AAGK97_02765 [Bacteroidota bacterium]